MLYTIIITHTDGTQTTKHLQARNAETAHKLAAALMSETETARAYPETLNADGSINAYNVMRGALQIAKRSAERAANNSGTTTQERIFKELAAANRAAAENGAEELGAEYLQELIAKTSADSQDFFADAYSGILDAIAEGAPIYEQYHNGYLSINAALMKKRAATAFELSTEFITEGGGAIVAINSYIAQLIKGGEKYTPREGGTLNAETAAELGAAIAAAAAALTPRQKQIIALIARGYSIADIAKRLNIKSKGTIAEHLTRIRSKTLEYFASNAPQFLYMIDGAKVNAAAQKKKRNAEYYREYRAKRKNK